MSRHALIVIDLQNDYFPGGKWPLHQIEAVADNAKHILQLSRDSGDLVIHVRHEFQMESPPFFAPDTHGSEIVSSMNPKDDEPVILKHQVNAFCDTDLKAILEENEIANITIIGAMSHMCIDAAARAAADYGFNVTVVEDACASRDLDFNGKVIHAEDVHASYMSALGFAYSAIMTTSEYVIAHQQSSTAGDK